jgi:hypothetical protein
MSYEEIIEGFRTLTASDFDYGNVDARGWERLDELTNELLTIPNAQAAIPELFDVMERLPDSELGSPGSLVHTLEKLPGYEQELVRSVRRRPAILSVWMINRILNTELSADQRKMYMELLNEAASHSNAPETVRDDARSFIEFQTKKCNSNH